MKYILIVIHKGGINMDVIKVGDKWCIKVHTDEFGYVLLLDNSAEFKPLEFDTVDDAYKYIEDLIMNLY
jgi:hypothetical protein